MEERAGRYFQCLILLRSIYLVSWLYFSSLFLSVVFSILCEELTYAQKVFGIFSLSICKALIYFIWAQDNYTERISEEPVALSSILFSVWQLM